MTGDVRVFVNERPVSVPPGAKVQDAVAAFDGSLAAKLTSGTAYVTDGVGRRARPDDGIEPGAIIRVVVSARRTGGAEPSE